MNPCANGGTCWTSDESFYCACRAGKFGGGGGIAVDLQQARDIANRVTLRRCSDNGYSIENIGHSFQNLFKMNKFVLLID